jgi:hypothetical protein
MVLVEATGTPLGVNLEAVPTADDTLLNRTLDMIAVGCAGPPGH